MKIVEAKVQVCSSISKDGLCEMLTEKKRDKKGDVVTSNSGKVIRQGPLLTLETLIKLDGADFVRERETVQGRTTYKGFLPITSLINNEDIKQKLSIEYKEDDGLSKIKYFDIDIDQLTNWSIKFDYFYFQGFDIISG